MASPKQIAANQRNAQKSTGPRTPEGKAAVRLNSLVHGLRTQDTVIPGEDRQVFEQVRQAFYDQYQPQGIDEIFCVDKMITSFWRNRRIPQMEAQAVRQRPSDGSPLDNVIRIARYEAQLDRTFYRAMSELRKLQAARPAAEPPTSVQADPPEIGFARQNQPLAVPPAPPKRYAIDARGKMTEITPAATPPAA